MTREHLYMVLMAIYMISCNSSGKIASDSVISLETVKPSGIAVGDSTIFISDEKAGTVSIYDKDGKLVTQWTDYERPMRMYSDGTGLLIPEFSANLVSAHRGTDRIAWMTDFGLKGPTSIHKHELSWAVADQYNHRVLFYNGVDRLSIGSEGTGESEFQFPSDAHVTADKLYVSDAKNNRLQVFDHEGKWLQHLGTDAGLNIPTGIWVENGRIYVCDRGNNRIVVFNEAGNLVNEITENIATPIDCEVQDGKLYVINAETNSIAIFVL